MKKAALFLAALALLASWAAAMTPQDIDAFLRNHTEEGFRFINSSGDSIWYVAFKLPDWTNEWSVAVILAKDANGNETLSVGTTAAKTKAVPSQGLMKFLLERNNDDVSLGSFSIYYDKDYSVQYFARLPNKFLTSDELLFYIGFVTAYCNKVEPEIAKFITP
jgi:opacity protein-like surface antigen